MNYKQIIVKIWKRAGDYNEKKIDKLKDKYNVKFIEHDEYWTKCMFKDSKVEFTIPHDPNFEDYDLTGNALKFAQKHYDICQDTYEMVDKELEKEGFEKEDTDEYFAWYRKDGKMYSIPYYVEKKEDIDVSEERLSSVNEKTQKEKGK